MGDSVSSATNAISDAAGSVRSGVKKVVPRGLREEVNRGAAVFMPTAYAGNAVGVATAESGGDVTAGVSQVAEDLGLAQTPPMGDPNVGQAAPTVADPQQKRRRQLAGRAGTLLTGGTNSPGGTNLGGAGGRSTLLGL